MAIEPVQIHNNLNAPEGANGVHLYNTDAAEGLTLGQLMSAVCLRAGAVVERQSVAKMNVIGQQNAAINRLSEILEGLAEETIASADWSRIQTELTGKYGLDAILLPGDLDSYANRMQAMTAIKQQLETRSQQSQEDMIDLQTLVNRRDVAYTAATNLVRALGQSVMNVAGKLTLG